MRSRSLLLLLFQKLFVTNLLRVILIFAILYPIAALIWPFLIPTRFGAFYFWDGPRPWSQWNIYKSSNNKVCERPIGEDTHIFGSKDYCYNSGMKVISLIQFSKWTLLDLCALVTAAKRNPASGVCALQADGIELTQKDLSMLDSIPNIQIRKLDPEKLTKGTPLETWYPKACSGKETNDVLMPQVSYALRLAYLSKYGGVALETDVLTIKSYENFTNVIGLEHGSDSILNPAVMIFEAGNSFVAAAMTHFVQHVQPNRWDRRDPALPSIMYRKRMREFLAEKSVHVAPPDIFISIYFDFTIPSDLVMDTFFKIFSRDIHPMAFKRVWCGTASRALYANANALHLFRPGFAKYMWNGVQKGSFIGEILSNQCSYRFESSVAGKYA